MRTSARAALLATIAAAAIIATPANAQDAAQPAAQDPAAPPPADASNAQTQDQAATSSDQDIVVTARRRSELLLDVPVAVTAYSGEQLNRQGALDITDISDTTPNVNFETPRISRNDPARMFSLNRSSEQRLVAGCWRPTFH